MTATSTTGGRVSPANPFSEFPKSEVEQSIGARFEKMAQCFAASTAVQTDQHCFSYQQLNDAANRIAHLIIAQGGQESKAVALLFSHDAPLVAAILAVLKAGRFYVVLDPSLPAERLRYIVQDCECDLVLLDDRHWDLVGRVAQGGQYIIRYSEATLQKANENPSLSVAPSQLAYLIYTSGSIGKPKGVCQTHRNVLHHIRKYTNACHLNADDRFTLLASCAVGASVSNLFGALLNGGTLLPFNLKEQGVLRLAASMREDDITIYHSVPTVFRHLAEVANEEAFPNLRMIKLGGEAITRRDFELYQRKFSNHTLLYVGLGSTEMNSVRYWILNKGTEFNGHVVPVGHAVEETDVLLLDASGREVADGETGEIAIRSSYLFPGYWRQKETPFVPDPAGSDAPVFRTRDLGRMLPGGLLQHLGRSELQIKVRGLHVDVAEVEAALLEQPEIKDCAVVAKSDRDETRLAAYLTSANGSRPKNEALRASLAETLPDFMIPAQYVWLDALPRKNAKIDRRALAASEVSPLVSYQAPRDELQSALTTIWRAVLHNERLGVLDDFFELGGHSLAAERIAASIEHELGYKVPGSTLFWATTVERLARHLRDETAPARSLVELSFKGDAPPLFIVHGWGGDVHFHGELARLLTEQPVYGLQAIGLDGKAERHVRVEDMAQHYLREMRTIQAHGPYHLLGYSMGSLIALEVAQQAYAAGESVEFLALLDPPTRPAPWTAYLRTIAPLLALSARVHLGRWFRSAGRESFHFKRRVKRLRRWVARNKAKSPVVINAPECGSTPPTIPGFKDYYSAVASSYRLQKYPGAIDLIIGEVKQRTMLPLWGYLAKGGVLRHELECSHKEMISREFLPTLAATLQSALADRRSKRTASG